LPTLRTKLKNALPLVIHAEGVLAVMKRQAFSSTPEACGVFSIIRAAGAQVSAAAIGGRYGVGV
jgi:hypothetical protein